MKSITIEFPRPKAVEVRELEVADDDFRNIVIEMQIPIAPADALP